MPATVSQVENVRRGYDNLLHSHKKRIDGSRFICPWCDKEFPTSEAQTIKVVAGEDLLSTDYDGYNVTKTYAKISYSVRLCKKCYAKNERNKRLFFTTGKILYAIFGLCFLHHLLTTDRTVGIFEWLSILIGYGFIAFIAYGAKESVIENIFNIVDIVKAYKNNAVI